MPRLLFFADTHLGFDLPLRPRVVRRRRGPDFFDSFESVLNAAIQYQVDGVVHGGDLFFRSKVPISLVEKAFEPLLNLARRGVPIYLVPGNHERSVIPATLFTQHPNIHLFSRPCTFELSVDNMQIALSGFPFVRHDVRKHFSTALEQTGWRYSNADVKLLCLHQSIQGATVGPHNYVFRSGPDVIPVGAIPSGFAAVLAGHIHRYQVLTHDLRNRMIGCPVIYAGSTERTSFAEKDEPKGFVLLDLMTTSNRRQIEFKWRFVPLPTRRMFQIEIETGACTTEQLIKKIKDRLAVLPADGIVQLKLSPSIGGTSFKLSASAIRAIAPPSMNITAVYKRR